MWLQSQSILLTSGKLNLLYLKNEECSNQFNWYLKPTETRKPMSEKQCSCKTFFRFFFFVFVAFLVTINGYCLLANLLRYESKSLNYISMISFHSCPCSYALFSLYRMCLPMVFYMLDKTMSFFLLSFFL